MAKSKVDVRRKPAAAPVSVIATDDDAGVASVQVFLASPQGPGGKRSYAFANLRRTAGTAKAGTFPAPPPSHAG